MMRPMTFATLASLLLVTTACDNAGQSLAYPDLVTGEIAVGVYIDRDGSLTQSAADTVYPGVRVALLTANGSDTLRTATTQADGIARFTNVPIGTYRVRVDRAALPDSLPVVVGDTGVLRILARQDSAGAGRLVRVGFREVSIAEARALAPGQRVFIRGTVLATLQSFRDSSTHLASGGSFIRVTGATHRPGRTGNNLGDSVIVLGVTGTNAGQPIMRDGLVGTVTERLAPIPLPITLAQAISANNGALDAALVELPIATITDTATVTPDFRVRMAIGNDTITVLLDQLLNVTRTNFVPGRLLNARGVLVPNGNGTWFLKPRPANGELTISLPPPPQP